MLLVFIIHFVKMYFNINMLEEDLGDKMEN